MRMPSTEIDDTASTQKMPTSRSANQASGPNGTASRMRKTDATTTYGARANRRRSARHGMMSSFWIHLPTSASSCIDP